MKKLFVIIAAIAGLVVSGCASQPISTFPLFAAKNLNALVASGQYQQKIDNFFVINDSSSSMTEEYRGVGFAGQPVPTKFSVEKEILNRINQTIPDLKLTAGIRSFGFGPCLSYQFTQLNLPPVTYSKSSFGTGIDSLICASGGSPLSPSVEGTIADLSATAGNIGVLILSDGHLGSGSVASVKSLKQHYGDRVCVYTIWVGNEEENSGINTLNRIADIGGCGFSTLAEKVASAGDMANFVQKVFLKAGMPVERDDDGDGVINSKDKCPDTLKGAHVNPFGCWVAEIKFDHDKSTIKPEYYDELDNVVTVIKNNPGLSIEVQGHTSRTGKAAYNQQLSERRAQEVKAYLLSHDAGASAALTARGYGWRQPVDTNDTESGRANNRRVEFKVFK
ncbi:OmpA/MotB domain protein [Candidatus Methylobacter favarea]|uniref:OmpA/MotB domain protein n=1 Tax=Candidatus Methylobacter favarea TaxID=2707345 RepID=A0A8S0XIJ7_9GAMM|nr:OmpA family protein [Candidatus Methylobacter favarea]CAA9892513.1 OmpA/MotB domain protein [Candidatus Methylobacter favarea]